MPKDTAQESGPALAFRWSTRLVTLSAIVHSGTRRFTTAAYSPFLVLSALSNALSIGTGLSKWAEHIGTWINWNAIAVHALGVGWTKFSTAFVSLLTTAPVTITITGKSSTAPVTITITGKSSTTTHTPDTLAILTGGTELADHIRTWIGRNALSVLTDGTELAQHIEAGIRLLTLTIDTLKPIETETGTWEEWHGGRGETGGHFR